MKKVVLLTLIIAFAMTACIKPVSLIGEYKGEGKDKISVQSDGGLWGEANNQNINGYLQPWDLGAVNGAGKYDIDLTVSSMGVAGLERQGPTSKKTSAVFSLDGSKVVCEIEINGKKVKFKK